MSKMKRILGVSVISALGCFAIILFAGTRNYTTVIDEAKIISYENADEVINDSVLIVRAKKTDETPKAYPIEHSLLDSFTLSTVKVEEVFKNSNDPTIVVGSEIDILESQWTDEKTKTVHHTEGYLKMETGREYVLLLGYNPSVDNYYPTGLLYGKIPVNDGEKLFLADGYDQVKETVETLRNKYIY